MSSFLLPFVLQKSGFSPLKVVIEEPWYFRLLFSDQAFMLQVVALTHHVCPELTHLLRVQLLHACALFDVEVGDMHICYIK
jgi:hypothetical protein